MKKALGVGVFAAVLAISGPAFGSDPLILPGGEEGCVSQPGDVCTYSPTRSGGYASPGGTWTITVSIPANGDLRDTNHDGKLRYVFSAANAPDEGCGFFGAGSTVTTNGGDQGVAAGNPFPGASDAAIGSANDCSTGIVSASNSSYTPVD